jgi:hypothetical protein
MKKIAISFGMLALLASTVSLATVPNWDITGIWQLTYHCTSGCSGDYYHTMNVTNFNRDTGVFSGVGVWKGSAAYTWVVNGLVSGNSVQFSIRYTGGNLGYQINFTNGEVMLNGTQISGPATATGNQEADITLTGKATEIPYKCVKIKEGKLMYRAGHYLAGQPLQTGYDVFGYNYQAHLFEGSYANVYLGGDGLPPYLGDDAAYLAANPTVVSKWYWPYHSTRVLMKWNDAWISNLDCNGDRALDRHYGYSSYIGSGAWETNHMWDSYEGDGGLICAWDYFTKIVAVPEDATKTAGVWYNSDGTEIGPDIWGEFATIQEVSNDPCAGQNGLLYKSPAGPGFGLY